MALDVEAMYLRYGPMVLRRCRSMLRDEQEAAEAMQETFARLLARSHALDLTGGSSLMYRIATNVCLNRIRSRARHPEDPDTDLLQRIAVATRDDERIGARRLLIRLFTQEQESTGAIAVMHLLDGMTLEEVADLVGLSVSGVRKRLRVLRARLEEMEAGCR